MGGELRLRKVDLRLDPDRYPVDGEKLDSPEKVVMFAADITKSMKRFHLALLAVSAKGNVLRVILTTKHTISAQGPGLAAVLRETLLSNCVGIIVVEKDKTNELNIRDEIFAEKLIFSFKECSVDVLDYIKVGADESYASMMEKGTDLARLYINGREYMPDRIKEFHYRDNKIPDNYLKLTDEGTILFDRDIVHVTDAIDAVIEDLKYKNREHLYVLGIKDGKPLSYSVISVGTINSSMACPGDILRCLAMQGADSFIMIHNHPSSCTDPSSQDEEMTKRVLNGARLTGIKLIDHMIVGGITGKYYSYAEEGDLSFGFKKWSETARETKDKKLINWFSACQYGSVKLGLLLNPIVDRNVVERLAADENEIVSKRAKERMMEISEKAGGIKGQIEIIRQENNVAENDRIYSYGKVFKK